MEEEEGNVKSERVSSSHVFFSNDEMEYKDCQGVKESLIASEKKKRKSRY